MLSSPLTSLYSFSEAAPHTRSGWPITALRISRFCQHFMIAVLILYGVARTHSGLYGSRKSRQRSVAF